MSWSTPVIPAEEQVAEEKVSQTTNDFECPRRKYWTLTKAELEKILTDHLEWLDSIPRDFNDERRAHLCKAILKLSALSDANNALGRELVSLDYAELNGAYLFQAKLNGAQLIEAELNGADLRGAELNGANLYQAELKGADLADAELNETNLANHDGPTIQINCFSPQRRLLIFQSYREELIVLH